MLVDGTELDKVRDELKSSFTLAKVYAPEMLNATWKEIETTDNEYAMVIVRHIYSICGHFALCRNHWKAFEFVGEWLGNWMRQPGTEVEPKNKGKKRGRQNKDDDESDGEPPKKKTKTATPATNKPRVPIVNPLAISTPILAPIQTATSSQNPSDAGYPRPRPANASRQVATPGSSSSTTTPTTASTTPSGSTPPSTTPAHANNEDQGTEKQALTESTAGPGTIDDGDEGNQSRPAPELTPPEPTTSEIRAEVAPASPQLSTALQTGDDAPQNEPQRQITMATDFFANIPSPQPSPQTTTSTSAPKTSTNAAAQPAIPSRAKSPVPAKKKLLVKDYKPLCIQSWRGEDSKRTTKQFEAHWKELSKDTREDWGRKLLEERARDAQQNAME